MKTAGKKIAGVVAFALSAAFLACAGGAPASASGADAQSAPDSLEETLTEGSAATTDKDETVYVIADANGNSREVIVSEWLKNLDSAAEIRDFSELSGIYNTSGDETFTQSGDNAYIWSADGREIHYNGTTDKALPVAVAISYYLDGVKTAPEDMAGKSGHITIRFDYENREKTTATINGREEELYVPFLMASGVVLDSETFSNVSVTNGTVTSDGSRNIVVGYGFPGLAESLGIDADDLAIPDSVTIEADTTDFSVSNAVTVAMTGLFNNSSSDADGKLSDLMDGMDSLDAAAVELLNGTDTLYSGIETLYDNCGSLNDGVDALKNGAGSLKSGVRSVADGAASLSDGLGALDDNGDSLVGGAKQMADAIFESATVSLRKQLVASGAMTQEAADTITLTMSNYADVFSQLTGSAAAAAESALRENLAAAGLNAGQQDLAMTIAFDLMGADDSLTVSSAVTRAATMLGEAAKVQSACSVINESWLSDAQVQLLVGQIANTTGSDAETSAKIAAVSLALDPAAPAGQIQMAIEMLNDASAVAAVAADPDKIESLSATAAMNASEQYADLAEVKSELDGVAAYYSGIKTYVAGVSDAYDGAKQLSDGASALEDGAGELAAGIDALSDGSSRLISGVATLKDGASTLDDGMRRFYEDGIVKLSGSFGGDFSALYARLQAVADAGRAYQSFGGIPDGMTGQTKFIFKTDAIG